MAKAMGDEAHYQQLMRLAENYKNLYDPKTQFIRPKLESGEFITPFDSMKAWAGFQEGNAYQFTWYIPHDIQGLIQLIGLEEFNKRLELTFNESQKSMFGGDKDNINSIYFL